MKLHEGSLYSISKRVNDGAWMHYADVRDEREDALAAMEAGRAFHSDRCPKDHVEWCLTKVY